MEGWLCSATRIFAVVIICGIIVNALNRLVVGMCGVLLSTLSYLLQDCPEIVVRQKRAWKI